MTHISEVADDCGVTQMTRYALLMLRYIRFIFILAVASPSYADDLRILTSFPSTMTDVFAELWIMQKPDIAPQILNKNTVSGVEEIQRGNARAFDLFWASSPEAFVILDQGDHFVDAAACGAQGPAPITEFAISSVGWARRRDSTLFMPGQWNDLLLPIYRDQIAMTRPARSGTTHLLVEQLLQLRGWDDGWAFFLELSGNLSTLTARSYGVPDGLLNDRFKIGLTIDFLATSNGDNLLFRYGRPMMAFSARIGILKGGSNTAAACGFVAMLISNAGQIALTNPAVSRIPIDPQVRKDAGDVIPPAITAGLQLPWLDYDAEVSAERYWAVNALFDLMITEVLAERRDLWRRYFALKDTASADDVARIRQLLLTMPVTERQAIGASMQSDTGLRPAVQPALGTNERGQLDQWRLAASELLAQATAELDRIESELAQ